jgi:hypothetical protein
MTWYIIADQPDENFSPVLDFEPNPPPYNSVLDPYQPLDEDGRKHLPSSGVACLFDTGYIHHILYPLARRWLVLSQPALEALKGLQPDGWESFPINLTSRAFTPKHFAAKDMIAKNPYYLVNVYTQKDIVDLDKSDISSRRRNGETPFAVTIHYPDPKRGKGRMAIKRSRLDADVIWHGVKSRGESTFFISDALQQAWCRIGTDPHIFFECIEVD